MYRIVLVPDGGWLNYYATHWGPRGESHFGVLLGPFSSAGPPNLSEIILEQDGVINQGAKFLNWREETNVEHYQISGDLAFLPLQYETAFKSMEWPVYRAKTKKNVYRYFTRTLLYGQKFQSSVSLGNSEVTYLGEWNGRYARIGYYSKPSSGSGTGRMTKYSWDPSWKKRSEKTTFHTSFKTWIKDEDWPTGTGITPVYDFFSYKSVDPNMIARATRVLSSSWGVYSLKFVPGDDYAFGDLAQSCMDQLRYTDVNSISFLKELPELASLIPKFSGWTNPRTYANAYLCFKYGLRLTVSDVRALTAGIKAFWALKSQSVRQNFAFRKRTFLWAESSIHEEYHYKLVTEPYPSSVMGLIRQLDSWGLAPTSARIWDTLPFSFVLDWVLDFSSLLERADTAVMTQYYRVLAVVRSRKVEKTLSSDKISAEIPWVGCLTLSWYLREVRSEIDLPIPRFDEGTPEFRNFAELASLIVVMSK